jgi:hypothetical protein
VEIDSKIKKNRLSRTKIEYMRCEFSDTSSVDGDVNIDKKIVSMKDIF